MCGAALYYHIDGDVALFGGPSPFLNLQVFEDVHVGMLPG